MKKYTVIEKDKEGNLSEKVYFAENSKEIKTFDGFITIVKTERVKHPSPEVLQRVILSHQVTGIPITLEGFYQECETLTESNTNS